jgi:hypothetical protein
MRRTFVVAEMALREVLRRRGVLAILLILPLLFYLTRRTDHLGQSIRFVLLGVSWALSTAALFAGAAARSIEPRLRLSGYRTHHLYLGRLAALWTVGLALALPYFLLIRFDRTDVDVRYGAIAVTMLILVVLAPLFGLALSAVLPRELEGTLVLLIVVGLQMMLDPAGDLAKLLPFWSSRELGTYAVDHAGTDHLVRGLAHGGATAAVLFAVVALAAGVRLRRRRHVQIADAH